MSFDLPSLSRRPAMLAGLAVSLLLHALLLLGYRPSSPPEQTPAARSLTVWLQPTRPPAPPILAQATPPTITPTPRTRAPQPRHEPARPPAAVTATPLTPPPSPAQHANPPTTPLPRENDPLYADQQPKNFDIEAARKAARKVTKEKDPAKAGTLTAQLEEHPLYPEQSTNELAQKLEGARRPSCLKSGGGLLAPLVWLMDKKDSGCKF